MKRLVLAIAALLCLTTANAQLVGGYKATTKQDIALKGATVINTDIAPDDLQGKVILTNAIAGSWETAEGKGFPIGFEFPFAGKNFTHFGVGSQGLIRLSETEDMVMSQSNYFCTQSSEEYNNLIFCYDQYAASYDKDNEEGIEPTTISYKTTDEGLVVEWKNLGINTSSWSKNLKGAYTMQIHLMKDGRIKYRFAGLSDVEENTAGSVRFGIRGGIDEYITFTDLSAKTAQYGQFNSFDLQPVVDGYTVTLNTPDATVTPTAQPTNIVTKETYSQSSISTSVTFDKAEGVDNYLMVISNGAPTATPVDGTYYQRDDEIGNAKVLLAGQPGSWGTSAYDLDVDTEYVVTVYAYNSFGLEGPKYNTVDPLQTTVVTAPSKPGEISVVEATTESVKLKVNANEKGQKVFVAYNDVTFNPGNMGNRAYVGAPDASLKVGDYLTYDGVETKWNTETWESEEIQIHDTEAGKVAYFGEAGEFEVANLDPSHSYYFIAYSYNEDTKTFSQGSFFTQAWTSTTITVPFELDLTKAPDCQAPGGWVATPGDFNEGFMVDTDIEYSKVKSQTEGNYVFSCQNMDNSETYKLASPTIELTSQNTLSVDWHVHVMAGMSYWFRKAALYDEWYEDDALEFVLYVDGEKVVLKKYDCDNAPVNENVYDEYDEYDSSLDWHSETFDLSAYAGKNVQFGIEWLGANSSTLYFGMENMKVNGVATELDGRLAPSYNNGATYNLAGQQVPATTHGIVIQNNKKVINK